MRREAICLSAFTCVERYQAAYALLETISGLLQLPQNNSCAYGGWSQRCPSDISQTGRRTRVCDSVTGGSVTELKGESSSFLQAFDQR
jgi:hypothetical protein